MAFPKVLEDIILRYAAPHPCSEEIKSHPLREWKYTVTRTQFMKRETKESYLIPSSRTSKFHERQLSTYIQQNFITDTYFSLRHIENMIETHITIEDVKYIAEYPSKKHTLQESKVEVNIDKECLVCGDKILMIGKIYEIGTKFCDGSHLEPYNLGLIFDGEIN